MEQKKTLWIVAASGIFLLVVFGAALIIYSKPVSQSPAGQAGFDPYSGWNISTTSATPVPDSSMAFNSTEPAQDSVTGLTPSPFMNNENNTVENENKALHSDNLTVVTDSATVYSNETTTIDLNSLKSSSNSGVVAKNEMTANQINTNRHVEASTNLASTEKYNAPEENYYTPGPAKKSVEVKTNTKKTEPVKSSSVAKKSTSSKNTTSSASRVAANAKKVQDAFWVQAAAYSSKRNADEARTTLESNKIPSEVFTFTDSNGKTFYRVRVGPYVTKSEAEYWQTRIGMIDKFAASKSVIVSTKVN